MLDSILYQNSIEIAVCSFVAAVLLTSEGFILYWWYLFLLRLNRLKLEWLSYPLGYCEKCLGGQIALWFYVFTRGVTLSNIPTLIVFICITILNIEIIKLLWKKIK